MIGIFSLQNRPHPSSPKYDKGNLGSSSQLYIVVFGGGARRAEGVTVDQIPAPLTIFFSSHPTLFFFGRR